MKQMRKHQIKKIVMFEGDIETTAFFSHQMEKTFLANGYETFFYNYEKQSKSVGELLRFVKKGETVVLSFNFHGLCGTTELCYDADTNRYLWDDLDIPCINIIVDHPYYYDHLLKQRPQQYIQICIDRNHEAYMERYYKEIKRGPFLPLAGTSLHPDGDYKPIANRTYDVVFVGNYIDVDTFEVYINRNGEEYAQFYLGILDELKNNTSLTLEEVAYRHMLREIPELTDTDVRETMGCMVFLDLYIRSYYRAMAVKVLVEAGICVHVFGSGWEQLVCDRPSCLVQGGSLDSLSCLQVLADTKISLNVMPWFKDGAHDRIFNSMLNGAVCVTDTSVYLQEHLHPAKDCYIYSLEEMDQLPGLIQGLLADQDALQGVAEIGRAHV